MNEDLKDRMDIIGDIEDLTIKLAKDMPPREKINALKWILQTIAIANVKYLAEHQGEDEVVDNMKVGELDLCSRLNVCLGLDIIELDAFRDFKNGKIDELIKEGKNE